MFNNRVYLLFLAIVLSVLSLLIVVISSPGCENCPDTDCSIDCNTLDVASTSALKYYNFTLNPPPGERLDVAIIYTPIGPSPFEEYNLYANETKNECPTTGSYDEAIFPGEGNDGWLFLPRIPQGTYHFLIECVKLCGNYKLNLTCGDFCGDGKVEFFEECDATYPAGECDTPYHKCVNCKCFDFRWTEAVGCDYYDYCEDGMDPRDVSEFEKGNIGFDSIRPCCNDTDDSARCCSVGTFPELNCSVIGAVRNVSVTAHPDYCYNSGYTQDVTDRCIDHYIHPNGVITFC